MSDPSPATTVTVLIALSATVTLNVPVLAGSVPEAAILHVQTAGVALAFAGSTLTSR